MELALKYPSSIMEEMGDMSDMNGMPARSGEISRSCLLRPVDLPSQRVVPALVLFWHSRR